jgi:hypothetical protein
MNRKSTYGNFENLLKERKNKNKNVKNQSLNDRFMKSVKEQKSRLIYSLMNKTKTLWRMNHFNNTDITLDIQNLSKDVFSKLKSCEENMTLRKKKSGIGKRDQH